MSLDNEAYLLEKRVEKCFTLANMFVLIECCSGLDRLTFHAPINIMEICSNNKLQYFPICEPQQIFLFIWSDRKCKIH